jgi:hypothetical protein
MRDRDQIDYHSDRAMRELDAGLTAKSMPAARAHLQLSSLHMERVRELGGDTARMKPPYAV